MLWNRATRCVSRVCSADPAASLTHGPQYAMAVCTLHGLGGLGADGDRAEALFRASADAGFAHAMQTLGLIYQRHMDYVNAMEWYLKAGPSVVFATLPHRATLTHAHSAVWAWHVALPNRLYSVQGQVGRHRRRDARAALSLACLASR